MYQIHEIKIEHSVSTNLPIFDMKSLLNLNTKTMKKLLSISLLSAMVISVAFTFTENTGTKSESPAAKKKVLLKYNYPPDKAVKYLNETKMKQTMDMQGMVMEANIVTIAGCSVKSAGWEADNLKLVVMIDTLAQTIESPNGYSGGTITEAIGKSFTMTISASGKELDLTNANELVFDIPGSGKSNATQNFADFFPDMPSRKIKPGYKWTSIDSVNAVAPSMTTISFTKAENTFDGVETIDGIDCVKITSILSGTHSIKTETQGMDVKTNGKFTGTGVVYFAIKEGYFVKQASELKLEGTLELTYPQEMSMPMTMEMSSVNEMVK
jgi:hypothetical protein